MKKISDEKIISAFGNSEKIDEIKKLSEKIKKMESEKIKILGSDKLNFADIEEINLGEYTIFQPTALHFRRWFDILNQMPAKNGIYSPETQEAIYMYSIALISLTIEKLNISFSPDNYFFIDRDSQAKPCINFSPKFTLLAHEIWQSTNQLLLIDCINGWFFENSEKIAKKNKSEILIKKKMTN